MTSTTMQFGPEWMRTKPQTPRSQAPPSPPPPGSTSIPPTSSYSSLVTPANNPPEEKRDVSNPFRYSKDEMLRIYKEGGKGGLGLEVERWEGIVRDAPSDPAGLKELGEAEKKLFVGSLNSEVRRRQTTDSLSPLTTPTTPGERPRLGHSSSSTVSPMRERFGSLMGKRKDGPDQPSLTLPRKISGSGSQLNSPRDGGLLSPRTRIGLGSGFDGVLNSGDSWTSRRKQSEAKGGTHGSESEEGESRMDRKGPNLKKEERGPVQDNGNSRDPSNTTNDSAPVTGSEAPKEAKDLGLRSIGQNMGNLPLNNPNSTVHGNGADANIMPRSAPPPPGPPPGLTDLASIEWSYIDPTGQVQGPFRADTMQKWHEQGYFTPDLFVKRTQVDADWITFGELAHRAGSQNKIFLTPLPRPGPPGLSPGPGLNAFTPGQDPSPFGVPRQPIPMRSQRSVTFDSHINNTSITSDSPSSSFGGGRFDSPAPDRSGFAGPVGAGLYPRRESATSQFGSVTGGQDITFDSAPRSALDSPFGQGVHPFRTGSSRGTSVDNHNFDTLLPNRIPQDGVGPLNPAPSRDPRFAPGQIQRSYTRGHSETGHSSPVIGNGYGPIGGVYPMQRNMSGGPIGRRLLEDDGSPGAGLSFGTNYPNSHGAPTFGVHAPSAQRQSSFPPIATGLTQQPVASPSPSGPYSASQSIQHPFASPHQQGPQSPWGAIDPTARRILPFDSPFPTGRNTTVTKAPTTASESPALASPAPPAAVPSAHATQVNGQTAWYESPQGKENGWGQTGAGPNSLTVSNLMQHNEEQERSVCNAMDEIVQPDSQANEPEATPKGPPRPIKAPKAEKQPIKSPVAPPQPQPQTTKETAAPPAAAEPSSPVISSSVSTTQPKPAWVIDEDKKSKPSGVTIGFREIQEAETKKAEARKNAERERERLARAAVPADEVQTFTTSWGLPTSQAGGRNSHSASKDTPVTSPTPGTPTAAPWTNAVKPPAAKKTMKEIQEEEERRKKDVAKAKDTVASAVRRAHETPTRASSTQPSTGGGAWTTIGAGGKPTAPIATGTPARPPLSTATSAPARSNTNGTAITGRSPAASSATVPKAIPAAKKDETPAAPSRDFLVWLSSSLKDIDKSVNLEETIQMLLNFPLDPDSSTVEIISDLIYASSTILNGRQFASEFVSRRKTDAATQAKGGAGGGGAGERTPSIADIVKAQPKPAQNDGWGGFKVVNKKKKGGRS